MYMDVDELKSRVRISWVVARYVRLRRQGNYQFALCPFHRERTPSFTVSDVKRFYHCFGCGAHGDVFDFVMRSEKISFAKAAEKLAGDAMLSDGRVRTATARAASRRREASDDRAARTAQARRIWQKAKPASGTPVEAYLSGRGINVAKIGGMPTALRFHSELYHGPSGETLPAMVAAVRGAGGQVVAVHRTYFARRTGAWRKLAGGEAKLSLGPVRSGAVRLFDFPAHGFRDDVIGVAEGIETALAVALLYAVPTWAAVSGGNMAALVPPFGATRVKIFYDNDASGSGRRYAETAAARFHAEGRAVTLECPPNGAGDFADVLAALRAGRVAS